MRAFAGLFRAQLLLGRGELAQARAAADALGTVRAWSVIGPFDNPGRAGLGQAFPPEREPFDPGASYPGKEHPVRWRTLPGIGPLGLVDLSSAISPRAEVTVYAASVIAAPRAQGAVLHLGASGPVKVWLAGELVFEDRNQHPARFDQSAVPVRLRAGDNGMVIKIAHGAGRLGFTLRLAGERDEPLPALARAARAPGRGSEKAFLAAPGEQPGPPTPLPRPPDALAELRQRAARGPADARAEEDLALLYAARRPDDDAEQLALHAQERAEEAAPGDAQVELRLARLQTRDANKRRAALERALERHPQDPELLEALGRFRLDRGDGWKALDLSGRALAAFPRRLQTRLLRARALEAVGLGQQAARLRLQIAGEGPAGERQLRARASALRRLGRSVEAETALEELLRLRFDDVDARAELSGLRLDRGDLDGALRLLGDAIALDPTALSLRLRAAELLSQNGRSAEAEAAWAEALRLGPDDADLHEAVGRHLLRQGESERALASFRRSLELRPQNPALLELTRSVKPEERYAAAWLHDAAALAGEAPAAGPDEDVEVLADLTVVKVFANGLSSRTRQLVVRALTARGVDQVRTQSVQFSPDRQLVRVERARILRRDGTVLESRSESERSLSEPWYGLYYDLRARLVSFPQLQAGDALELVTRVDDSGANLFADYFGDFSFLQSTARKRNLDYLLLGPPGRSFYARASPLPGLVRSEEKLADGGTLLRFHADVVARVVPEPEAPGASELFGWVHVSTYRDWEDVARFYWGLVKDPLRVTEEVRRAAAAAVAGAGSDPRARIRAVYGYVLSKTRYVGLEFGINSFKPYPVDTILSRRFGDCKDKASLLHAMLEALGIDSRLVLLRTRRRGQLEEQPASLAVFDHAILYVPSLDLFLDGTAEFHGSEELPAQDRGASALIVEPGGAGSRLVRIPEAPTEANGDDSRALLALSADGGAELELRLRARGALAADLRRAYQSPDERRTRAEEQLARGAWPGVKVAEVEVSDPRAIEAPVELRIRGRAASFAAPAAGGSLRFVPFGERLEYANRLTPLSRRSLPLQLPEPQRSRIVAEVRLPEGFSAQLPGDASGQGPRGRWSVSYAQEPGLLRATFELELRGGVLPPADYPAFRAYLGELDQALGRAVVAAPSTHAAREAK